MLQPHAWHALLDGIEQGKEDVTPLEVDVGTEGRRADADRAGAGESRARALSLLALSLSALSWSALRW